MIKRLSQYRFLFAPTLKGAKSLYNLKTELTLGTLAHYTI